MNGINSLIETGFILEQYGLVYMNQSIAQICNYAVIQESMGNINLVCERLDKAKEHLQTAMKIYERIWADEPEWIENKYEEIKNLYVFSGISTGKVLVKNEEDV